MVDPNEARLRAIVLEARNVAGSDTLSLSNRNLRPVDLGLICNFFREPCNNLRLASVAAVDLSQNHELSVGAQDSAADTAFVELLTSDSCPWRYLNIEATGFGNKPCRALIEQACNRKFITLRMGVRGPRPISKDTMPPAGFVAEN